MAFMLKVLCVAITGPQAVMNMQVVHGHEETKAMEGERPGERKERGRGKGRNWERRRDSN